MVKGSHHSPETLAKLRAKAGKGAESHMYGRKVSPETRAKLSVAHRGRKLPMEQRQKMSAAKLGHTTSPETRAKIGLHWKGDKNPNWKGGVTDQNSRKNIMRTPEYRMWRTAVFERDDFTCQNADCNIRGGKLHAHHIKRWADYPELRYVTSNGVTLCEDCHYAEHRG